MRSAILIFVLLLLAPIAAVHAQAAGTPRERAVALFAQSVTAYREGRFDEAASLLDEAYALQPEPVLLYNLGRAREGAGNDDGAAEAYRRYLDTEGADPTDASAARARLSVLDRRIEERHALEARAAERERESRVAIPEPAPAPAHEVAIAPWILAGGGAVLLVVGGVLGGLMLDRDSAAQHADTQVGAVSAHADAESFAIGADVLYGVGALALGIGVIWGIVDLVSSPSTPTSTAHLRWSPTGMMGTF